MSRFLAVVILVACDAGAKPAPPTPVPAIVGPKATPAPVVKPALSGEHVVLASIERGPCYGTCPVYSLTVFRDGKVEYVGTDFVKKKGKGDGTITAEQAAALDKLFTDGKYLDFKNSYENDDATDMPSAKTSYRPLGGSTKIVAHYYGDMHAPKSLSELEDSFDTIVKSDSWIGTDDEREQLTRRH